MTDTPGVASPKDIEGLEPAFVLQVYFTTKGPCAAIGLKLPPDARQERLAILATAYDALAKTITTLAERDNDPAFCDDVLQVLDRLTLNHVVVQEVQR